MVDRDRVSDLLVAGEAYLTDTRRFADEAGRDRFLANRGEQYRVEFPLQQAIQIGIDLAAHLLADQPGRRPGTLAGMFVALADRELIPADLATRLAAMARFRNLLVHEYADVDPEKVWTIVSNDLDDLEAFFAEVARTLEH